MATEQTDLEDIKHALESRINDAAPVVSQGEAAAAKARETMAQVMEILERDRAEKGLYSITVPGGSVNTPEASQNTVIFCQPVQARPGGRTEHVYIAATQAGFIEIEDADVPNNLHSLIVSLYKRAQQGDPDAINGFANQGTPYGINARNGFGIPKAVIAEPEIYLGDIGILLSDLYNGTQDLKARILRTPEDMQRVTEALDKSIEAAQMPHVQKVEEASRTTTYGQAMLSALGSRPQHDGPRDAIYAQRAHPRDV